MLLELRIGNDVEERVNQEKPLFLNIKIVLFLNIKNSSFQMLFLHLFKLFKVCFGCVGDRNYLGHYIQVWGG